MVLYAMRGTAFLFGSFVDGIRPLWSLRSINGLLQFENLQRNCKEFAYMPTSGYYYPMRVIRDW